MTNKAIKRKKTGRVVSDKMDKTVIVKIERMKNHPAYTKKFKVSKSIAAHDGDKICKVGDIVEIEECVPISKTKSWKVVRKIS